MIGFGIMSMIGFGIISIVTIVVMVTVLVNKNTVTIIDVLLIVFLFIVLAVEIKTDIKALNNISKNRYISLYVYSFENYLEIDTIPEGMEVAKSDAEGALLINSEDIDYFNKSYKGYSVKEILSQVVDNKDESIKDGEVK